MEWKVQQNFLLNRERGLLKACFRETGWDPSTVKVSALGRYGNSGAKLLLCYPGRGAPLVAKIHTAKKITDEFAAMKSVEQYFPDAQCAAPAPAVSNGSGALLYRHRGARTQRRVDTESYSELSKMVFGDDRKWRSFSCCEKDDKDTITVFRKMFRLFEAARYAARKAEFVFRQEYERYTRQDEAKAVLSAVLGENRDRSDFSFLGAENENPLTFIEEEVFNRPLKGWIGPVHGDLHATNIMVDKDQEEVHLIDFAWARGENKPRHVLVDYVLMECSLRFLLFPHHVEPNEQMEVDKLLLIPDGAERLIKCTANSRLAEQYARLGLMLREIRDQAKPYLSNPSDRGFFEYMAAQFLILFGQMTYRDYNRFMVARTLGIIARKLKTDNFGMAGSKKA